MAHIGLGTWQSEPHQVERAVEHALKVGYRHVDAAVIYGNQPEVAEGIRCSGVPRSELFIVSKLWCNSHRPGLVEADLDNTLKQLGTDYLGLPSKAGKGNKVVIDTEAPGIAKTWGAMVKLLETKKVKAIGVSNFTVEHLEILAKESNLIPAVNQVEAHSLLLQDELLTCCTQKCIHLTAYSRLGQNINGHRPVIQHPKVLQVAEQAGTSPAQRVSVIPQSVTPSRIETNFAQLKLSSADAEAISSIVKTDGRTRFNVPFVGH
ncbi:Aldo/keto reductase [Calocera viscosa TUFC12733]|uniref:Aldo/keto reductase n=1 Tax=Calocera viscosa (strain TUFC12733) TaxID=1330018 RepID=A0A167GU80_CALVF|nr:Aldo/keto reductase [Calocera viscosa TUFC12733]